MHSATYNYRKCLRLIINHRRRPRTFSGKWYVSHGKHSQSDEWRIYLCVHTHDRDHQRIMRAVQQMCQCCKLKCTLERLPGNYSHITACGRNFLFFLPLFALKITSFKGICSLTTIIICLFSLSLLHDNSFWRKMAFNHHQKWIPDTLNFRLIWDAHTKSLFVSFGSHWDSFRGIHSPRDKIIVVDYDFYLIILFVRFFEG